MAQIKSDGSLQRLPLSVLHLDKTNPRFGGREDSKRDEPAILREIVGQHDITDVISSISANGFFDSEPLVGAINKGYGGEVTIVEGNRRLTACLVLTRDPRAEAFGSLADRYTTDAISPETKLPVQVYDWANIDHKKRLLPYFGIRHIVGPSEWDSYAKAAWVSSVLKENMLTLEEIRRMIGDDARFTDRILEGYNVVRQVIATNAYDPAESLRGGRGSFSEFPFSWVYTALGYKKVRSFLALPKESKTEENPIADEQISNAGELLQFMFGGNGQNAAIDDSREIKHLATALGSEETVSALRSGYKAEEAAALLEPVENRAIDFLRKSDAALEKAISVLSGVSRIDRKALAELNDRTDDLGARYDTFTLLLEKLASNRRKSKRSKD